MFKIWWMIWKIEIWSEELVDGHQTPQTVPYQPRVLFWGVNCMEVFATHFKVAEHSFRARSCWCDSARAQGLQKQTCR